MYIMKGLNGLLTAGVVSLGLVSSAYTGQESLDEAEQIITSYSQKAIETVQLVKTLQSEKDDLLKENEELKKELDRNWNTVEEVNSLIAENKTLRDRISMLEEQLANTESIQEIEIANQSAENHLEQVKNTLDESIFNGIVQ